MMQFSYSHSIVQYSLFYDCMCYLVLSGPASAVNTGGGRGGHTLIINLMCNIYRVAPGFDWLCQICSSKSIIPEKKKEQHVCEIASR